KADGGKFGKTEEGNVWLDPRYTSPYKFYQFWINVSDEDAEKYIKTFTFLNKNEIDNITRDHVKAPHERMLQKTLAREVTTLVHSKEDYEAAVEASQILFGKSTKESLQTIREDMFLSVFEGVPQFSIGKDKKNSSVMDLLSVHTAIFSSKGELKRMVQGGGLMINKQKVEDTETQIDQNDFINGKYLLVQKGKKNYYLITLQN
ncbi:hypothetical protein LCGC14_2383530, partial [marine sediment metagenome]